MVEDGLKQQCVRVTEHSEGYKVLIVCLEHIEPALNIINFYGRIEGTDHFAQELVLILPSSRLKKVKETGLNTFKPGAWEAYKEVTKRKAANIEQIVKEINLSEEEVMKKVNKIEDDIKREAFGKTKIKKLKQTENKPKSNENKKSEEEEAKDISQKILEHMEEQINKITNDKNKGRCGQIYKVRELVEGPKKAGQEAQAIKDPSNGEIVVNTKEIKRVTLDHCLKVLKNNEPHESVVDIVDTKNKAVEEIMKSKGGDFEVTEEAFEDVMKNLEFKNKRSYDLIVKADNSYKRAMFGLCKRILSTEMIPKRFFNTQLVQLYKGKGSAQELSNSRFLHLKDWLPRVCESLAVNNMKEDIIEATTKFQCGGVPRMRPQFHLFVIKSTMALAMENKEGRIFTLTDIVKFYDKEMLNDAILAVHGTVDKKALREWWKMNKSTLITVKTGMGNTETAEAGAVLGQGSKGASP